MTRYLITINTEADRQRLIKAVSAAPWGTRAELKARKRSVPQNDRFWAMLTDVAMQAEHCGRKYTPEVWKILFMHGWQREVNLVPSLDGKQVVPLTRSSDLSREEMGELTEFIAAWGAENGVTFHEPEVKAA